MKTSEKNVIKVNLNPSPKQVKHHTFSISRKYYLGLLFTIMFITNTNAQPNLSSRFYYNGSDEKVKQAIRLADDILASDRFWNDLRNWSNQYIDNTDALNFNMAKLADVLKAYTKIANIKLAPKISFHVSNALTNQYRTLITRPGLKQDVTSLAVTIVHEWAHAVDYGLHGANNLQFEHFNKQYRCLNKETASYRVERVMELILGNPDFAQDCPCQAPCYLPCQEPTKCPTP